MYSGGFKEKLRDPRHDEEKKRDETNSERARPEVSGESRPVFREKVGGEHEDEADAETCGDIPASLGGPLSRFAEDHAPEVFPTVE